MTQYFKDLYNKFIETTLVKKILIVILIFGYIFLLLSVSIKVNYEVTTPGSINDTVTTKSDYKPFASIDIDTNNTVGKIYTVGVYSHVRVSLFQYLIAQLSSNIARDNYNPDTDLSKDEQYKLGVIQKDSSIVNAIIVAYEAAAKVDSTIKIDYEFQGIVVNYVYQNSESNLMVGDIITHIGETKITNYQMFKELRDQYPGTTPFYLTVIRDGKEKKIDAKKIAVTEDGVTSYLLGIGATTLYKVNEEGTYPKYKIANDYKSIGSSGGAMLALSVYNSLVSEDITKGKFIIGTGTIDIDGKIGNIAGVEQKIATAAMYPTDIFFVNSYNYEDALKKYNEIKPAFKLVKVDTFTEILNALAGEK